MRRLLAVVFAGTLACVDGVTAQNYPTQPITMIVPFAAGGPVDTLARIVTERMRPLLGQPVVVENVTGAAGSTGVGRVARAPPARWLHAHRRHLEHARYEWSSIQTQIRRGRRFCTDCFIN
jgi:tripartite-type tricarboxylate transporter receptor subunit TctC